MSTTRDAETGRFVGAPHAVYETRSDGYCRWRAYDRARARESYVYVHQLLACLDDDPNDVFADANEVHHQLGVRWLNTPDIPWIDEPCGVEVREKPEHCNYHMNGRNFDE